MQNEFYSFIQVLAEKLIGNMQEKDNNIVLIKHYNTFEITREDIDKLEKEYSHCDVTMFYRKFYGDEMVDAYDPFLGIIKSMYEKHYSNQRVEEFLNSFEIYSLQKEIIKSYIKKIIK